MATREDVLAALKAKGYKGPIPNQQQQAQPQGQDINSMIQALTKSQRPSMQQTVGDALTRFGGGTPTPRKETDLSDIANLMKIQQMQNPGQAPEGYQYADGKLIKDETFVSPKEQLDMDWRQSQMDKNTREQDEAVMAKDTAQTAIKDRAERNLATVEEIEKGIGFFGPYGDAPSLLTSAGGLRKGHYDARSNWEANLDRLRGELTFEKIQELKNASETGATGLGPVSEIEFKTLTDSATALRRNLGPAEAAKHIKIIKDTYNKILGKSGFPNDTPPPGGQRSGGGGVEMQDAQGNRAIVYPDGRIEEIGGV